MTAMRVVMEDEPSSIPAAFAGEVEQRQARERMRALVENALKDEIAESTEQVATLIMPGMHSPAPPPEVAIATVAERIRIISSEIEETKRRICLRRVQAARLRSAALTSSDRCIHSIIEFLETRRIGEAMPNEISRRESI